MKINFFKKDAKENILQDFTLASSSYWQYKGKENNPYMQGLRRILTSFNQILKNC